MRKLFVTMAALGGFACLASVPALADSCAAQATAKKLHGAAETSFMNEMPVHGGRSARASQGEELTRRGNELHGQVHETMAPRRLPRDSSVNVGGGRH